MPPLRSRPRRIGCGVFFVGMMATVTTTSTETVKAIFHRMFRFKIVLPPGNVLRLRISGHDTGDRGTRDLHFHVFGDLQVYDFGLNTLNRPVNPAGRDYAIALFERTEHFLRLLP